MVRDEGRVVVCADGFLFLFVVTASSRRNKPTRRLEAVTTNDANDCGWKPQPRRMQSQAESLSHL